MTKETADSQQISERLRALLDGPDDEALRAFLAELHAADVADCMEQIEPEQRSRMMFLLPPRKWAEAIALLEEAVRSDVLEELTDNQVSEVLKELPADDAVDVLDELEEGIAAKVVERLPPEQKAVVEPLRLYDEDTAGGIMNPDYVSVPAEGTVADAVDEIRRLTANQAEETYYIYCVDAEGRLEGVVPAMRLLVAPPTAPVRSLLLPDLFTVRAEDDQEEVKNRFEKYDVAALPVVDDKERMLGVITHDDVLDVAEEEAEEDMYHMAGTDAEEFARAGIFHAASVRARWLLPCLAGTLVSVSVLFLAEPRLGALFFLIVPFNSPIAAMGGNAGVQTSTVIVRALATGDVMISRLARAFAREFRIAVTIATGAGLLSGFVALWIVQTNLFGSAHAPALPPSPLIGLAVGVSMALGILVASTLAMTLPFLFRRLGIDPAIATGPLITTVNDGLSATLYMVTAIALLT